MCKKRLEIELRSGDEASRISNVLLFKLLLADVIGLSACTGETPNQSERIVGGDQ